LTIVFPPLLFFVKKSGKRQGHQIRFTKSERALNSINQQWILEPISKMHLTLNSCVTDLLKMLTYYPACCAFSSAAALLLRVICYF